MKTEGSGNLRSQLLQGVRVVEDLLDKKQYNLCMIKARQTLELMVRFLADRACLVDVDLATAINELYRAHHISKPTCEHYHKIRMAGNKAVHENYASPREAAFTCQYLEEETHFFVRKYLMKNRTNKKKKKKTVAPPGFFLLLFLIVAIIIIISITDLFTQKNNRKPIPIDTSPTIDIPVTAPPLITEPETEPASPAEAAHPQASPNEVKPETPASSGQSYQTTAVLNIREKPSTDSKRIGQFPKGANISVIKKVDEDWSLIQYKGKDAYVAHRYLSAQP